MNDENLIGAIENEKDQYLDVGFKFQVTNVKKALLSVRRMNENGSSVQFGPEDKDNFIQHVVSKRKVYLRKQKGHFCWMFSCPVAYGKK